MKPLYLRFESEQAMRDALLANGFEYSEDGMLFNPRCELDVIGVIRGNVVTDDEGDIVSQEPDVPGWHVNLLVPASFTCPQTWHVVNVKTPVRVWAGYEVHSDE